MNAFLHAVQVAALLAMIGVVVGSATYLSKAAAPELAALLERYGPALASLGRRVRSRLPGRRG